MRALPHAAPLILENEYQLERNWFRTADPILALRQGEMATWYLENCERLAPEIALFRIPGNDFPSEASAKITKG